MSNNCYQINCSHSKKNNNDCDINQNYCISKKIKENKGYLIYKCYDCSSDEPCVFKLTFKAAMNPCKCVFGYKETCNWIEQ